MLLSAVVACGPQNAAETSTLATSESAETGAPPSCEGLEAIPEDVFPERMAEAVCARMAACGCSGADAPQCGQGVIDWYTMMRTYANQSDLVYDGRCLTRKLQMLAGSGCTASDLIDGLSCEPCFVYSGRAQTGEACEWTSYNSAGMFLNPCAGAINTCQISLGQCGILSEEGDECFGDCGPGLVCTYDHVCVSADVGEPCVLSQVLPEGCAEGLWCKFGVCQKALGIGAYCTRDTMCVTRCENSGCADVERVCELTAHDF